MTAAAVQPERQPATRPTIAWPIVIGFAALAIPTAIHLAEQSWSRESGAQGPIIIATGGWLLYRQWQEMRQQARPGPAWLTALVMVVSLAAYAFGRAYDFITLEAGGVFGVGLAILNATIGPRQMLRQWFPLIYLAFAVPPPQFMLDSLTAPLKQFVSVAATHLLSAAGYPISREGVILFVAQYELLVEDACSGMNSLFGLTAIGLFYVYLMRGSSWLHSLLLTAFIIPIAIGANVLRIMTLVLITYYLGNEAAQGFLHGAAGIVLFVFALGLVFAVDQLLSLVVKRRKPVQAPA
jgi:exosortase B